MTESGLLGARYELGEPLGQGGMAEVRKGQDTRLGRSVAVKMLRTDLATDPTFQARFRREAQSAASLNHPSIVAVYDTGEETVGEVSVPYIVMEYVEGRTLRDVLREGRRLLPERALEITGDVLSALEYSHRAGIVHRDIKPANVMLTPGGDVKVMDFGIARAVADASATMTQTAAVIGTAQYLSPEQARGESVDARSDIYSTGCLLYELLTHSPPFTGDSPVSVAYQHVREEPRPPSMVDPEISPEADAITLKALAKRAEERYQTAGDMRADIERGLAGLAVSAPVMSADATARYLPASDAEEASDEQGADDEAARRRRKKWYTALAILAALALIAIAALFLLLGRDGTDTLAVPDVVEMSQADAEAQLQQAGFTEDPVIEEENSEDVEQGNVISQDPEAEEFAPEDQVFTLTVSLGVPDVTIPEVVGSDVDEATRILEDEGLDVTTQVDNTSDQDANIVTEVNPSEGSDVPADATVTLTYSGGTVEVPDVLGETETQATATLETRGFNVETDTDVTDEYDEGTVIHQAPEAGERQQSGTTVTIILAEAPEEPEPTEPPDEPTDPPPDDEESPPPDEDESPPPDEESPPPEDEDEDEDDPLPF